MTAKGVTESVVEDAALAWLDSQGWTIKHGAEIAPGELFAERGDYGQVVLEQRLRDAMARLNQTLPAEAVEDAFRRLTRPEGPTLEERNRALHRLLVDGVTVEYHTPDGSIRGAQARAIDFDEPENNDWLAVNQFTVVENKHTQGSGESLTMAFYAGRVIREPAMENPTIVVLTDQNDLDDRLFGTFSRCQDLLASRRCRPESRTDLRGKLSVEAGGVIFTTIRKFMPDETEKGDRHPLLSDRRKNVVQARSFAEMLEQRTLRKHGYPPDKQEKATQTVLEQAEVLSAGWAVA